MWYKDAIIYELHVKSFFDSNDDGYGDFRGLTAKVDYLADLGVSSVWLLPFYPSPLRDDGYDISDYYRVHSNYGTLQDFRRFLKEAHKRDIRVITELVINHTSDQHGWFQRSRSAPPGSAHRDFYVWSSDPERYPQARVIFKDYESSNWSWDSEAGAYYWHRFYSHQPDLNFDNPRVRREILRVLDFWFGMGVDGMRLDAIPYLYEREGTNCENLEETHTFLKSLRAYVDDKYPDRMLLAEANQWPEDAVAYFGQEDECHLCYHFPVMPRLYMSLTMEDRFPVVDIMEQTPPIPESCQWAMFLRNHDELTLEMVTDEERDHMYRVYARDPRARLNLGIRRRLAPLLGNDRTKIELMNILLFSLPGAPIIYYGDEIGMGDNYYLGDRDGVRTPMQWSADRNAGFSRTGPHQLYLPVIIDPEYHFEALNVETQNKNSSSLLWWMKRLISVRKNYACLSRGDMEFLFPDNPRVLAFTRSYEEQTILIVSNLSRFHQVVELDLGSYSTCVPKEVFSLNRFPHIGEEPYRLTLGPYGYLWLTLEREQEPVRLREPGEVAELNVQGHWRQVLRGEARKKFERQILPVFLESCTWFPGKNGRLKRLRIEEELRLSAREDAPTLLLLEAEYSEDPQEHYLLPLDFAPQEQALEVMEHFKSAMICRLTVDGTWGLLYDGGYSEMVRCAIFDLLRRRRKLRGLHGDLVVLTGRKTRTLLHEERFDLASRVLSETREYSNTSIVFENRYFLKMYRRFEDSSGPDAEVARFLSEEAGFRGIPRYLGSVEYHKQGKEPLTLCLLQEFVPNQGEAWSLAQSVLSRYYETMLMENGDASSRETIGSLFIELTERLGQCTAAMHRALASFPKNPRYAPEPFSKLYQRSLYQSLRSRVLRALSRLEKRIPGLSDPLRDGLLPVFSAKDRILAALNLVRERTISGKKTRIHGDFNLSQVLFTGNDFLIIDYEGEQGLAASAKVLKYSPLRDVADMILSFHVAAHHALAQHTSIHPEDLQRLEPYAAQWQRSVSRHFIYAYREAMAGSALLPEGEAEQDVLLRAFLLDKAINAVLLEIEGHQQQALIPLRSIQSLLEESCFESD